MVGNREADSFEMRKGIKGRARVGGGEGIADDQDTVSVYQFIQINVIVYRRQFFKRNLGRALSAL